MTTASPAGIFSALRLRQKRASGLITVAFLDQLKNYRVQHDGASAPGSGDGSWTGNAGPRAEPSGDGRDAKEMAAANPAHALGGNPLRVCPSCGFALSHNTTASEAAEALSRAVSR